MGQVLSVKKTSLSKVMCWKVVGLSLNTWSSYVLLFVLFSVDVMRQIDIPSVFVSEETAISLKEEYYYEAG